MTLYENPVFRAITGDTWRPGGLEVTRQGLALCAWPEQALVADVGCGPGGTVRLLRATGIRALAFDRTPAVPDAVAADAVALPLANASLDGVVCECVLSLLPEPERAVCEFFRVLRPGGRLLCSDLTRQGSRDTPASCTQGALSADVLNTMLTTAGFVVLHCQDHSHALKKLAAQLLWHNVPCFCATSGSYSYRQWVALKPFYKEPTYV